MLWITLFTLIFGLSFIFAEFFVPGSALAILGSIALVGSTYAFHLTWGNELWTLVYFALEALLVALTCFFAIKRFKKSRHIYLAADQSGYLASEFDHQLIGQEGIALTPLRLSGHIEIEGNEYQAMAQSRFIEKGTKVKVIGGQGASLIVKMI